MGNKIMDYKKKIAVEKNCKILNIYRKKINK